MPNQLIFEVESFCNGVLFSSRSDQPHDAQASPEDEGGGFGDKEGVITKRPNGRYGLDAVTAYARRLHEQAERTDFSTLLEKEKYRALKRKNDRADERFFPVEVLERALKQGVAAMIPILQDLPTILKKHWPEVPEGPLRLVRQASDELCLILRDAKIKRPEGGDESA